MKLTKTAFLAASALMCAACTTTELQTYVTMGWSIYSLLGQTHNYEGNYYTVVKFKFACEGEYTFKPSDFTITLKDNNADCVGQGFAIKYENVTKITEVASELKLQTEMLVMFKDAELPFNAKNVTGKIKNTSNIPLLTATPITFKK